MPLEDLLSNISAPVNNPAMPSPPDEATLGRAPIIPYGIEGFIDLYAYYADVLEAPRAMHEMVAIQIAATILNKNGVTIPMGAFNLSMDLWAVLLSGSGFGRSTLLSMANPVLEAADVQDLVLDSHWGSSQAR